MRIKKDQILGVNVFATTLEATMLQIDQWVRHRAKKYICIAPVATLVDAQKDRSYRKVVNEAGLVTPDGMPVVWLMRLKGHDVKRTYGPDLMKKICEEDKLQNYRHFFYGGNEEVLEKLTARFSNSNPDFVLAGKYSPGMLAVGEQEQDDIIHQINEAKPDILWVGLGSPKQDYWMSVHRELLDVPVIIGVGAAFDFLSGTKQQAPKWMQSSGLEWLFRLSQEPQRLWKRYLIGNSLFMWWVFLESLGIKRK